MERRLVAILAADVVGYGLVGNVVETKEADWDRLIAVNVKSEYLGCKHAIPEMRRQGGGVITTRPRTRPVSDCATARPMSPPRARSRR